MNIEKIIILALGMAVLSAICMLLGWFYLMWIPPIVGLWLVVKSELKD